MRTVEIVVSIINRWKHEKWQEKEEYTRDKNKVGTFHYAIDCYWEFVAKIEV
jgi:hypothetical protein